ncbi:MAG TPA: Hsp20/alpha crystallin family protein [Streptosporangiaceae bacterium]|nr:Hsp20/alpha crystallin family protein [Streptosporangiaceae bacterium]
MRRDTGGEVTEFFTRFDHMFDEWTRMMPLRAVLPNWPDADGRLRVEEFREDGTLVVRADLPGIDPDHDVQLTVSDGMLRIDADRHEEEQRKDKGYLRQELRYGSWSRALPLPAGATEADIKASYKDGILEVRIPEAKQEPAKKIPIATS